jgi:hypothetical protein
MRLEIFHNLDSPVFGWRPADGASVAINFYRNGFRLLYPQVFWGWGGKGYVETEFPLEQFGTAVLFKVFGVHDYVNLILPLLCGFGLVWLTYCWGRRFFDARVGLYAAWLVAVAPVHVMLTDTGLWADAPSILCATLGLYWLARWSDEGGTKLLVMAMAATALGLLTKLNAVYIGIPIAYIFLRKYGLRCFLAPACWAVGAGIVLPTVLWYAHAYRLYQTYGNTFGILGAGDSKFATVGLLTHPFFYTELFRRVLLYHLTPLFTIGFGYGLYRLVRDKNGLMLSWLVSIVVYTLVLAKGVNGGHYQYLLNFLPVGALTAAIGVDAGVRWVERFFTARKPWLWRPAAVALVLLFSVTALASERRFVTRDRQFDNAMWLKKKITGQRLKPLTKPDTLLIVVDTAMDHTPVEKSMTPPDIFYFSDRRGWYLSMAWLSVPRIEELHAQGASVLVVSGHCIPDFKEGRKDMYDYLSSKYQLLMDDDEGLAFALDRPK